MGFRDDVIQEYEEKETKRKQEQATELARKTEQALTTLKDKICAFFGLPYAPAIETVASEHTGSLPDFYFKIDDVQFVGKSGYYGPTIHVITTCKHCGGQILSHSVDSRTDVGLALSDEDWHQTHVCETEIQQGPPAGPLVAFYRIDSSEYRLLEAVKELIYDHAPSRD
jgi:hypothetical protein